MLRWGTKVGKIIDDLESSTREDVDDMDEDPCLGIARTAIDLLQLATDAAAYNTGAEGADSPPVSQVANRGWRYNT